MDGVRVLPPADRDAFSKKRGDLDLVIDGIALPSRARQQGRRRAGRRGQGPAEGEARLLPRRKTFSSSSSRWSVCIERDGRVRTTGDGSRPSRADRSLERAAIDVVLDGVASTFDPSAPEPSHSAERAIRLGVRGALDVGRHDRPVRDPERGGARDGDLAGAAARSSGAHVLAASSAHALIVRTPSSQATWFWPGREEAPPLPSRSWTRCWRRSRRGRMRIRSPSPCRSPHEPIRRAATSAQQRRSPGGRWKGAVASPSNTRE